MKGQICADCSKPLHKTDRTIKVASGRICGECYNGYQESMEVMNKIVVKKEKKRRK